MAHPSDLAPALIALKAEAILINPNGKRKVPLQDFFVGPNHYGETILNPDEYLAEIYIPTQTVKTGQVFIKERIRHSADFALSSVAAVARISSGVCEDVRIVLGGVAPVPYIALETEEMMQGKRLDESLISRVVEASVEGAKPLPMNGYKVDLTKTLVKRALASILNDTAR